MNKMELDTYGLDTGPYGYVWILVFNVNTSMTEQVGLGGKSSEMSGGVLFEL
jgi:hypothetical protein